MRNPDTRRQSFVSRLLTGVALVTATGLAPAAAQTIDPPGFAPVTLKGTQIIRLNVLCFEHGVGYDAAAPCRGDVMFHDANGRELKRGTYDLEPGQAMFLQLAIPATDASGMPIRRVLIIPCVLPQPGGVAAPTVEVIDRDEARVVRHVNPAAVRMSEFNNSLADPGSISGFDPQPDPPVFGVSTLRTDQAMRLNVFCFEHAINGVAPEPCRGTIMFHDAAGNVLKRAAYDLAPGASQSIGFAPGARVLSAVGIVPCIVPEPGGRAVPSVEVLDADASVVLQIGPVATRASRLEQVVAPR